MSESPKHFGPYEILEELGRGSTGIVYKARDIHLKTQAALKMLVPGPDADWQVRGQRFLRECRAMAAMRHPNIVPIYQVGEVDGRAFCAREFVDGEVLARGVEQRSLAKSAAIRIIEAITRAIEHVHSRGLAHRNLSAENILVARDGNPKLVGFSRAIAMDVASSTLQPSGRVPSSRELCMADIAALGAILHTCLAACFMPPLNPPVFPPEVESILAKCRDTDTTRQYQGVAELADDLRALASF